MDQLKLPFPLSFSVLAAGGDLKCRPAFAEKDVAFSLGDLGDLAAPENQDALEALLEKYRPDLMVADLHPGYFTTQLAARLAAQKEVRLITVQHHRAHIAAVCLEHGLYREPVIGLAFDGTGYGDDGTIWGGEIFTGSLAGGFQRRAHFAPLPLPGGDAAVRQPWRIAVALLAERGADTGLIGQWTAQHQIPAADLPFLQTAWRRKIAVGRSTSLGRWFDAVSALLGIRTVAEFEAQPAIDLQKAAEEYAGVPNPDLWPFSLTDQDPIQIDFHQLDRLAQSDRRQRNKLALAFHAAVARAVTETAVRLSARADTRRVVFSGGVFLNRLLTRLLEKEMSAADLQIFQPRQLPPGDQALAFGQIGLVLSSSDG